MKRAQNLLASMGLSEHEGVLVYNPSNMFYLSGYSGEGLVLITHKTCAIVTDFRYTEQAEQQAPDFEVFMMERGRGHEMIVGEICRGAGVDTLYYEDDYITVSTFERCRRQIPGTEWKSVGGAVERLRQVKDDEEIRLITEACRITGEAFERLLPNIKEGVTEKELGMMLDYDMMRLGASGTAFSTIVAAGAHGSLPHAVPGDIQIRKGDMITFDFGARYGHYCADMTRTVALGKPSDEMRKVYQTVLDAQMMAQDAVAAGKCCRDIDAIARDYIDSQGYKGRFGHSLGHSLGIDIHEDPRLGQGCTDLLKVNQLMTVEPGIYLPGIGGVRIENTVVVKEDGCEALTKPTRELIIL